MKLLFSNSASVVLIGSAIAVFGSLIAAFGVYLGSLQDTKESQHLLASVTGGDSYPMIIISSDGSFFIYVEGKYPLHEVQGDIVDVESMREVQAKGADFRNSVARTQYFEVGTLSPAYGLNISNRNTARIINIRDFIHRSSYRFIVHLYTRYHTFRLHIALEPNKKQKGLWDQAWQVFRDQEQKPMAQLIPPDFPLNEEGTVDFLLLPKT